MNEGEPTSNGLQKGLTKTPKNAPTGGVSQLTPSLNGHTDAFWKIVDSNPDEHSFTLALRLHREAGINLTGAQVKSLIEQGKPSDNSTSDDDLCPEF